MSLRKITSGSTELKPLPRTDESFTEEDLENALIEHRAALPSSGKSTELDSIFIYIDTVVATEETKETDSKKIQECEAKLLLELNKIAPILIAESSIQFIKVVNALFFIASYYRQMEQSVAEQELLDKIIPHCLTCCKRYTDGEETFPEFDISLIGRLGIPQLIDNLNKCKPKSRESISDVLTCLDTISLYYRENAYWKGQLMVKEIIIEKRRQLGNYHTPSLGKPEPTGRVRSQILLTYYSNLLNDYQTAMRAQKFLGDHKGALKYCELALHYVQAIENNAVQFRRASSLFSSRNYAEIRSHLAQTLLSLKAIIGNPETSVATVSEPGPSEKKSSLSATTSVTDTSSMHSETTLSPTELNQLYDFFQYTHIFAPVYDNFFEQFAAEINKATQDSTLCLKHFEYITQKALPTMKALLDHKLCLMEQSKLGVYYQHLLATHRVTNKWDKLYRLSEEIIQTYLDANDDSLAPIYVFHVHSQKWLATEKLNQWEDALASAKANVAYLNKQTSESRPVILSLFYQHWLEVLSSKAQWSDLERELPTFHLHIMRQPESPIKNELLQIFLKLTHNLSLATEKKIDIRVVTPPLLQAITAEETKESDRPVALTHASPKRAAPSDDSKASMETLSDSGFEELISKLKATCSLQIIHFNLKDTPQDEKINSTIREQGAAALLEIETLITKNQWQEALALCDKVSELFGKGTFILPLYLHRAYILLNLPEESPTDANCREGLALIQQVIQAYHESRAIPEQFKQSEYFTRSYFVEALLYARLKDLVKAKDSFNRALQQAIELTSAPESLESENGFSQLLALVTVNTAEEKFADQYEALFAAYKSLDQAQAVSSREAYPLYRKAQTAFTCAIELAITDPHADKVVSQINPEFFMSRALIPTDSRSAILDATIAVFISKLIVLNNRDDPVLYHRSNIKLLRHAWMRAILMVKLSNSVEEKKSALDSVFAITTTLQSLVTNTKDFPSFAQAYRGILTFLSNNDVEGAIRCLQMVLSPDFFIQLSMGDIKKLPFLFKQIYIPLEKLSQAIAEQKDLSPTRVGPTSAALVQSSSQPKGEKKSIAVEAEAATIEGSVAKPDPKPVVTPLKTSPQPSAAAIPAEVKSVSAASKPKKAVAKRKQKQTKEEREAKERAAAAERDRIKAEKKDQAEKAAKDRAAEQKAILDKQKADAEKKQADKAKAQAAKRQEAARLAAEKKAADEAKQQAAEAKAKAEAAEKKAAANLAKNQKLHAKKAKKRAEKRAEELKMVAESAGNLLKRPASQVVDSVEAKREEDKRQAALAEEARLKALEEVRLKELEEARKKEEERKAVIESTDVLLKQLAIVDRVEAKREEPKHQEALAGAAHLQALRQAALAEAARLKTLEEAVKPKHLDASRTALQLALAVTKRFDTATPVEDKTPHIDVSMQSNVSISVESLSSPVVRSIVLDSAQSSSVSSDSPAARSPLTPATATSPVSSEPSPSHLSTSDLSSDSAPSESSSATDKENPELKVSKPQEIKPIKNPFEQHSLSNKVLELKKALTKEMEALREPELSEFKKIIALLDNFKSRITLPRRSHSIAHALDQLEMATSQKAFLVGGIVRDAVIGRDPYRIKRTRTNNSGAADLDVDLLAVLLSNSREAIALLKRAFPIPRYTIKETKIEGLFTIIDARSKQKLFQIMNSKHLDTHLQRYQADPLFFEGLSRDFLHNGAFVDKDGLVYTPLMGTLIALACKVVDVINKKALFEAEGRIFDEKQPEVCAYQEKGGHWRVLRGLLPLITYGYSCASDGTIHSDWTLSDDFISSIAEGVRLLLPERKESEYSAEQKAHIRDINLFFLSKVLCQPESGMIFYLYNKYNIIQTLFPGLVMAVTSEEIYNVLRKEAEIDQVYSSFFVLQYREELAKFYSRQLIELASLTSLNLEEAELILFNNLTDKIMELAKNQPLFQVWFEDQCNYTKEHRSNDTAFHPSTLILQKIKSLVTPTKLPTKIATPPNLEVKTPMGSPSGREMGPIGSPKHVSDRSSSSSTASPVDPRYRLTAASLSYACCATPMVGPQRPSSYAAGVTLPLYSSSSSLMQMTATIASVPHDHRVPSTPSFKPKGYRPKKGSYPHTSRGPTHSPRSPHTPVGSPTGTVTSAGQLGIFGGQPKRPSTVPAAAAVVQMNEGWVSHSTVGSTSSHGHSG